MKYLLLVFVLASSLFLMGCDDPKAVRDALNAERVKQVDAYAAALAKGDVNAQHTADSNIKKIDTALAALNASVGPDGKITLDSAAQGTLTTASTLLPFPWNVIITGVGGLLLTGIQQIRVNRAAANGASIVSALDTHNVESNTETILHADAVDKLTPGAAKMLDDSKTVTVPKS